MKRENSPTSDCLTLPEPWYYHRVSLGLDEEAGDTDLCQALNDTKGNRQELLVTVSLKASPVWFQCIKAFHVAYLHNSEEDKRDEDVDLGVFPGMVVADVVKLLRHTLTAPCPIVKQRH